MAEPRNCPRCGAPLPEGAAEADCARCLLAAGLESGADAGSAPAPAPTAPSPEEMGKHFPQFELLELLGQGGMGIVYKAKQRSLDRVVAIKVMPPEAALEKGFSERFTREARTLARLQHPNIVGVHEFGVAEGLYYLVMEYVDGANLREAMRAGKLAPREALAIVPQVCDALQYAHDQGIVHRDIKPENILLDRAGRVRIADFGLAKIVQRTPVELTLTRAGQVMGTLHYMAPEQYRTPDSVDHRADIYSLGVVFYEMLTGELPLGSFPLPSDKPGVDARLDGVVMRALERERDRRWQHASDVKTQVSAIASGPEVAAKAAPGPAIGAEAPPVPVPAPPPSRLHTPAVYGALAAPLSLVFGFLAWIVSRWIDGGDSDGSTPALVAFLVYCSTLVVGCVVSIGAWAAIKRSGGSLHGLPWAVLGTFLGPAFLCCGAPLSFMTLGRVSVKEDEEGRSVRMPFINVEEKDGKTRVRMPFIDVTTDDEGTESGDRKDMVSGGPAGMTDFQKRMAATGIEVLWVEAITTLGIDPQPGDHEELLSPRDRAVLKSLSPEERARRQEKGELGLPFAGLGSGLNQLRPVGLHLDPDGETGRAVRSSGTLTVSFPVRREGDEWMFTLGTVEKADRAPEEGDRDGWLGVATAPGAQGPVEAPPAVVGGNAPMPPSPAPSPAPPEGANLGLRVSGGPAGMPPSARHVIAASIEAHWAAVSKVLMGNPRPHDREGLLADSELARWEAMTDEGRDLLQSTRSAGLAFGSALSDIGHQALHIYRLYLVALAPDGGSARVLRTNGTVTIAYPVVRNGDRWMCALGPLERADRGPRDEDRSRPLLEPESGEPSIGLRVLGGPPGMTEGERSAVLTEVEALVTRNATGFGGKAARLYCVRLDADGRKGRIVVATGNRTQASDILREGGKWVPKNGGHNESARRVPFPDDRDGWLHR